MQHTAELSYVLEDLRESDLRETDLMKRHSTQRARLFPSKPGMKMIR